jgi:branched-subunit amino acid transport protein
VTKQKGQRDKQRSDQTERTKGQKTHTALFVLLSFLFGLCVVCPFVLSVWSLRCLSFCPFCLVTALFVPLSFLFGHCVVCPLKDKGTNNAVTKQKGQKDRQRSDQTERTKGQTTQSPNRKDKRKDNAVTKQKGQKDKQRSDQTERTKGQTTLSVWSLRCLSFCPFCLVTALFVPLSFLFGHCVVCPFVLSVWSLRCLSLCPFCLVTALFVPLSFLFQSPNRKDKRTDNAVTKQKGQKDKQRSDQTERTKGQTTQ